MKKQIKFKQIDDTELDITVSSLNFKQRNSVLKKFIDVNRFMKVSDKKSADLLEFLKEGVSILDFQYELLETCLNIQIADLEPEDADKLFNENIDFMIKGGSKN